MLNQILSLFPAHTHPLTLVSDPDGLLGGEAVLVELGRRGFTIIAETDPVLFRFRVEQAFPSSPEHPVLVITAGPLEALPYDIWQPAYRIQLSVHEYFPNLAYPVVRTLTADQLERLSDAPAPAEVLGRQKTIDFLLKQVFEADASALAQPHQLIPWLARYHQSRSGMPILLQEGLVERLKRFPVYRSWNLVELVGSSDAFSQFMESQWGLYIAQQTRQRLGEKHGEYLLAFEQDERLQDLLPELIRKQVLDPIDVETPLEIPGWARAGIIAQDTNLAMIISLIQDLGAQISPATVSVQAMNWAAWQQIAEGWARLNAAWYRPEANLPDEQKEAYSKLRQALDVTFVSWLSAHYSPLGAQKLPTPKHVFHIPDYLAYQRSQGSIHKFALFILDGMSLSDWHAIQSAWRKAHPAWNFQSELLLAQIPTITAISRHALISGQRPADFASDLGHIPTNQRAWETFWSRQGLAEGACACKSIALDRDGIPAEIESHRIEALCLIDVTIDELTHSAVLGAAGQQASLKVWLDSKNRPNSQGLEALIDSFLDRQFDVFIASDHGHVEARGFGQPSEGLLAQTRGKRARLYEDRRAAQRVQDAFAETILWEGDGLLPENLHALMPSGRRAFTTAGETVLTHGGLTLDEVVVPFIHIQRNSS